MYFPSRYRLNPLAVPKAGRARIKINAVAGTAIFDHRGTGAGRRHDERAGGERADGVAGQLAGAVVVAAVEVGLAAARLRRGEFDRDAEPPQ